MKTVTGASPKGRYWLRLFAGFSMAEYESQLDLALRPVTDAAKLAVTRTSYLCCVLKLCSHKHT